jgi:small subunit ribosomal protein S6
MAGRPLPGPVRMTPPPPTYDLVLLLDPAAEEAVRAKILEDIRDAIAGEGELTAELDWGNRALAFQIEHRKEAEYRLFQFHATPTLLEALDRSLRIADAVIRFRIIRLDPGTPAAPDLRRGRGGDVAPDPVGESAGVGR